MKMKVTNWFEVLFNRYNTIRKAVFIRKMAYRIGGSDVELYNPANCPKHKRWLWRLHHNANSAIYNANWDICTVFYNKPYVESIKDCVLEADVFPIDESRKANPRWNLLMEARFDDYRKNGIVIRLCRAIGGSALDVFSQDACPWHLRKIREIYQEKMTCNHLIMQDISDLYMRHPNALSLK